MRQKTVSLLLVLTVCLGLCGCGGAGYQKGNGETSAPVRNLEVDWNLGSVTVRYHAGDTVLLEETSVESIPGSQRMRWTVEGDTLRVYSVQPGKAPMVQKKKHLILTLPEDFRGGELEFTLAAADLKADVLRAEELDVETEAGNITLTAENMREISLTAGAGNIALTQRGSLDSLEISSATGETVLALEEVRELEAESASGGIRITAQRIESAEIETDVGDVELFLPAQEDFSAKVSYGSGSFDSGFNLTREGDRYVAGFGRAYLEIETASGTVRIDPIP